MISILYLVGNFSLIKRIGSWDGENLYIYYKTTDQICNFSIAVTSPGIVSQLYFIVAVLL